MRTLPVKLSIVSEFSWGLTALSVVSILPAFAAILLVQRHLVRGLTLGLGPYSTSAIVRISLLQNEGGGNSALRTSYTRKHPHGHSRVYSPRQS